MKNLILSIVLVNLLAACATETPKEAINEPVAPPVPVEAIAPVITPVEPQPVAPVAAEPAPAPAPAPEAVVSDIRSVFFPFDVDAVQPNDRVIVQAAGEYLSKNKTAKVRVEGNADERGSSEYNLALGQRRANNVKKMLILSGAKAAQIETVSFGEEKPRSTGHDEASWSQNRRADIVSK